VQGSCGIREGSNTHKLRSQIAPTPNILVYLQEKINIKGDDYDQDISVTLAVILQNLTVRF
jgi:hypothetical protein